jgi:uncharacterized protein (TIGR02145 family)
MKKILAYVMLALIASLWGCSDMGDRDNPTDPGADNFDASLVPGSDTGDGGNTGNDGEGAGDEKDSSSSKGFSSSDGAKSSSSSSKGSSSSVTPKSSDSETSVSTGTMTDSRDGQTYKTVKIGDQVWMAQNLNYKSDNSYCYNDSAKYCSEYGRLYTWADAMESCPTGWHLPSRDEFVILANIAGGSSKAGKPLMAKDGWNSNGGGYDTYSFAALPGGARNEDGEYVLLGEQGSFWLASEDAFRFVANNLPLYIAPNNRGRGLSVRCLMDTEQPSSSSSAISVLSPCKTADSDDCEYGSFTDERDGHTYKTVKIGDQEWMAENLNFDYNVGSAKSYCYDQSELNCDKYGRLYTWAAAMDSSAAFSNSAAGCGYLVDCSLSYPVRGVCPEGWILPDSTDMVKLIKAVGNYSVAGSVLRSVSQGGTDSYGFNLMMAGMRNNSGNYVNKDAIGYLWMSHPRGRYNADHILFEKVESARYYNNYRYNSYSVRCLKDNGEMPESSSSSGTPRSSGSETGESSMTDSRDGQTYKTVKIGDQVWMAQNLNFETDSSFCYNDEDSNCAKYGRLYRWAVAGSVCPSGWHLPSKTEWETLFSAVGGESTAGKALKSSSGWSSSGNGTDDFGFSALPAGELDDDIYSGKEQGAFIWSSTKGDSELVAYALHLYYEYGAAIFGYYNKDFGFSVRCIQD